MANRGGRGWWLGQKKETELATRLAIVATVGKKELAMATGIFNRALDGIRLEPGGCKL